MTPPPHQDAEVQVEVAVPGRSSSSPSPVVIVIVIRGFFSNWIFQKKRNAKTKRTNKKRREFRASKNCFFAYQSMYYYYFWLLIRCCFLCRVFRNCIFHFFYICVVQYSIFINWFCWKGPPLPQPFPPEGRGDPLPGKTKWPFFHDGPWADSNGKLPYVDDVANI